MALDFSKKNLHDQLVLMDGLSDEFDWSKARFRARLIAQGALASDDWSMRHMLLVQLPAAQAVFGATTTSTTTTTSTSTTTTTTT